MAHLALCFPSLLVFQLPPGVDVPESFRSTCPGGFGLRSCRMDVVPGFRGGVGGVAGKKSFVYSLHGM